MKDEKGREVEKVEANDSEAVDEPTDSPRRCSKSHSGMCLYHV